MTTTVKREVGRLTTGGAALAAACAALCCAGAPIIVSVLTATGIGVLKGSIGKISIGAGMVLLILAAIWNARKPRNCDRPLPLTRSRS